MCIDNVLQSSVCICRCYWRIVVKIAVSPLKRSFLQVTHIWTYCIFFESDHENNNCYQCTQWYLTLFQRKIGNVLIYEYWDRINCLDDKYKNTCLLRFLCGLRYSDTSSVRCYPGISEMKCECCIAIDCLDLGKNSTFNYHSLERRTSMYVIQVFTTFFVMSIILSTFSKNSQLVRNCWKCKKEVSKIGQIYN